jgi:hypothetical protein
MTGVYFGLSIAEALMDQRGIVGVSTLRDGKIYANTSVHYAWYDVKRAIRNGYGVRVLYDAPGSGSTTTLHAAVFGKPLDGTVVGNRAIVFQSQTFKAECETAQFPGPTWGTLRVNSDGAETTPSPGGTAGGRHVPEFCCKTSWACDAPERIQSEYSRDLAPKIHAFFQTQGGKKKGHEYKKGLKKHCNLVVGIDDVEFDGGLGGEESKDAQEFFQTLFHQCEPVMLIMEEDDRQR